MEKLAHMELMMDGEVIAGRNAVIAGRDEGAETNHGRFSSRVLRIS